MEQYDPHRMPRSGSPSPALGWLRDKIVGLALSGVLTIQALQILILPTWLDIVTNAVILGLVWLVARLHRD